jgi:hypothetical protein
LTASKLGGSLSKVRHFVGGRLSAVAPSQEVDHQEVLRISACLINERAQHYRREHREHMAQ